MAVAVVQVSAEAKTTGTTVNPSLTGVTAGNTLIAIACGQLTVATGTITSTGFTADNTTDIGSGGLYAVAAALRQSNVAAGSHSPTLTLSDSNGGGMTAVMLEVSGLDNTAPLDVNFTAAQISVPTTGGAGTLTLTGTDAATGELAIAVIAFPYGNQTTTLTAPSGWTKDLAETNVSSYAGLGVAHQVQSGTSVSGNWGYSYPSGSYSGYFRGFLVSYKPASGGGTTYNQSVSGTVTPTGATTLAVRVAMALAGSLTLTAALAKRTSISLTGAVTAAGAIAKRAGKSLAGSVTGSGSLKRSTSTALTGSTTPTGTLSETAVLQKAVSGAITLSTTIATVLIHGGGAAKRAMTQIALFLGIRL